MPLNQRVVSCVFGEEFMRGCKEKFTRGHGLFVTVVLLNEPWQAVARILFRDFRATAQYGSVYRSGGPEPTELRTFRWVVPL